MKQVRYIGSRGQVPIPSPTGGVVLAERGAWFEVEDSVAERLGQRKDFEVRAKSKKGEATADTRQRAGKGGERS